MRKSSGKRISPKKNSSDAELQEPNMIKKRRNLFIMLVVIVLMLSATVGVIVASSNETRFTLSM